MPIISPYIIEAGQKGSDRLDVLAKATWGPSESFLRKSGLVPGMRILDLGCGNGEIVRRYGDIILQSEGEIVGLDVDQASVEIATQKLSDLNIKSAFYVHDIAKEPLEKYGHFDIVYCRFILSHQSEPEKLLSDVKKCLKPNGVLVLEDVDFSGHFCSPENRWYDEYVRIYTELGLKKGANPLIGKELYSIVTNSGFVKVMLNVSCPSFFSGDGKKMALLTFENIAKAAIESGMIDQQKAEEIVHGLEEFTADPVSLMGLPRVFQVSCKNQTEQ